jgi:hypothetical protein
MQNPASEKNEKLIGIMDTDRCAMRAQKTESAAQVC